MDHNQFDPMMESTDTEGLPLLDGEFPSPPATLSPNTPSPNQEICRICMSVMRTGQARMDCHQCRVSYHYSCYHRHLQTSPRGGCPACRYGAIPEASLSSQETSQTGSQEGSSSSQSRSQDLSHPFLPLQQEPMSQGAAAPFMPPMIYQDPQIDQRALAYSLTKCALFCFLFFTIPAIPIAAFVLWPYSVIVWLGGIGISALFPIYTFVPQTSIHAVRYLLYASMGGLIFSSVFGTVLASTQALGWVIVYGLVCGLQAGFFLAACHKLYHYRQYLLGEGILV